MTTGITCVRSIGRQNAAIMGNSRWWEGKSYLQIVQVQLFIDESCCPFHVFHEAIEKHLGRPVLTHEFGSVGYGRLIAEFLETSGPPSPAEIAEILPASIASAALVAAAV